MNDLLQQFLVESRELVAQATDDLLALERTPGDAARFDSAFRAFHTLKGAAGIVDFDAMARALHAAEDALARGRGAPMPPAHVGDYLSCLDQVIQWLDHLEASGAPPADAEARADLLVRRFAEAAATPGDAAGDAADDTEADLWVDGLLAAAGEARAQARTALRLRPAEDCFFRGDDPLAVIETLPGLLVLRLEPAGPWPPRDEIDPFACRLVVLALLSAPEATLASHLHTVHGQMDVVPLSPAGPQDTAPSALPAAARALLEAQLALLSDRGAEAAAGRIASAGRLAENVLRRVGAAAAAEAVARAAAASAAAGDPGPLAAAIRQALAGATQAPAATDAPRAAAMADTARTLRVDVARIDALVKLTGEVTVAKNAVGHIARLAQTGTDLPALAARLKDQHALLARLTDELQSAVLNLRVLPLRHVFQRFPRLVREISADLGKPVRLVTEGEATEADKAVVEAVFEPLLHVVRNALDHGIEPPARRSAAGKPAVATLRLHAARQGERVVIAVADDGGGIDLPRVRRIAAERGVAGAEAVAALSDAEAIDLIFRPGFSTAETVTGLSGRGVGMDAVRAALARMGGSVAVDSRTGHGTTVRFTLPFTVMVTRVMTVEAGGQAFGIPMDAVVETVRVPRGRIVRVGAAAAFTLRERTVPLLSLARELGGPADGTASAEAQVVVIGTDGQIGGFEVDRLGERLDVVLQPMDGILTGMRGIAGTTLLGDGRVLLVLDVQEML
ncbi:chemotaxis protein CheA [Aquabacter spiritensis]|uniref:Chemotaxis protein CheA n=1 Tax=Aquabacter spiritensis TaxID=933073 RepID=A0A4R3LN11_9HYPH|nr:chemotaxis protein CheA [Aquabacter spiritensis]TCT01724.1 two-component system chemotaxis sensor kinase CheA [Aquabacter spiritensis]